MKTNSSLFHEDGSIDIDIFVDRTNEEDAKGSSSDDPFSPCIAHTLDCPVRSYADLELLGNDAGSPIRARLTILGYRVEYFEKMFDFSSTAEKISFQKDIKTESLSTESLKLVVRRVYGEPFPDFLSSKPHFDKLLEIWHFCFGKSD